MIRFLSLLAGSIFLVFASFTANCDDNGIEASWSDFSDREDSLAAIEEYVNSYKEIVTSKNDELYKNLVSARDNFHQLNFAMLTTFDTNEIRLSYYQILRQAKTFRTKTAELKKIKEDLSYYATQFEAMKDDVSSILKDDSSAAAKTAVNKMITKIDLIKKNISDMLESVTKTVAGAEETNIELSNIISKADRLFEDTIYDYYFEQSESVFSQDTQTMIPVMMQRWIQSVDKFVKKKIPDTFVEWKSVLISFALIFCIVFLPILFYLNRYLKTRISITKYTRRLIIQALVYLIFAICILFSLADIIFPETIIFSFIWILLISRWGMDFAWALKNLNNPDDYGKSPLMPLFWVYFAACFFQFLNIPEVILTILWPGFLLIAFIHILQRPKYPLMPQESYFRKISIFLLAIFIAGSMLGYVNLSIFLTASWFILMIGFQFSFTFSTIFKNINEKFVKNKILKTLSLGIGMPLIWLAVIATVIGWAGYQYLNINIVIKILESTIDIYGVKINIILIILGVFLFFVVKTILHVIRSSLDVKYGANEETGGILPVFHTMTRYAFWTLYVIVVLKFMDISITSIAIIAGGLSVGIGLGLQGFVTSFVNGIIILMNRTVRVGDVIQVDNMQARVLKIDLRNTLVQTYDNAIVSVPNSQILNNKFINWTLNNKLVRRQIDIRVKYGVEVEQVKNLIVEIALKNTKIKKFPEPSVQLSDFTDGGMIFSLKIWLDDLDNESVILSDLRYEINKTLMANNIIKIT